ncbi:MAG: glycosyltransferase, partial [Spirulinaceae cyanobacterium]
FGLPIVEAMACGCPVITCPNASIPEVAGEAAIYVDANNIEEMANAFCEVQKPAVRNSLINQGIAQAKKFSWSKMADKVSSALVAATLLPLNLNDINLIIFPDWSQPEEELGLELTEVLKAVATHPDKSHITLLVDGGNISTEDANLFLSGVAMNLLMEEDLDITEDIKVSLVSKLSNLQWENLLPQLHGQISLKLEDSEATIEDLPVSIVDNLHELRAVQLKQGSWQLIKLGEINLIISPNWQQEEASLLTELSSAIASLVTHPQKAQINLLIDIADIPEDEANLVLASVAMNLFMEEELEVTEGPEIVIVPELDNSQWSLLVAYLHGQIVLESKGKTVVKHIPTYQLSELQNLDDQYFNLNLAEKLFYQGQYQAAIKSYEKVVQLQNATPEVYLHLGECWRQKGQLNKYITTLKSGIEVFPQEGSLYFPLIIELQRNWDIKEAIKYAQKASELLLSNYTFTILKYLLVPSVYDSETEINHYRQRYISGLQQLIEQTELETPEQKQEALAGVCRLTNFHLGYQAQNDVELQIQYGNLVHRIMGANYPQWVEEKTLLPVENNQKIRIGYVSAYLHSYSGTLWLTGWLRYCDRTKFTIHCYYTGNSPDGVTEQFKEYSDVFHHIPHNLEATCQQIINDKLHILIYPEIG